MEWIGGGQEAVGMWVCRLGEMKWGKEDMGEEAGRMEKMRGRGMKRIDIGDDVDRHKLMR